MSNFHAPALSVHTDSNNDTAVEILKQDADLRNRQREEQAALQITFHEREERLRSARDQISAEICDLRERYKNLDDEITAAGEALKNEPEKHLEGYAALQSVVEALNAANGHVGHTVDSNVKPSNIFKYGLKCYTSSRCDVDRVFTLGADVFRLDEDGDPGSVRVLSRHNNVSYDDATSSLLDDLIETNKRIEDAQARKDQADQLLIEMPRWRQGREAALARHHLESTDRGREFLERLNESGDDIDNLLTAKV